MPANQISESVNGPYYDGNSVQYEESPRRSSIISASDLGDDDYSYHPRGNVTKKRKREDDTRIMQEHEQEWIIFADSVLDYFVTGLHMGAPQVPPGYPMDRPIDDQLHTVLHWACAMGDVNMIQRFLEQGANPMAQNIRGETPAMRAICFTNSYEAESLGKILDLLNASWDHTDNFGGTLLHHVAMTTASISRRQCARYYAQVICSQMQSDLRKDEYQNILDAQDRGGNTALHHVARNSSKKNIKVLLGFGASTDIPDNDNITVDRILGNTRLRNDGAGDFPFTSSPLREPKSGFLHSGDATHQVVAASQCQTKAAQSFSDSFADTIPSKGLQLSLAMDAESQEKDQNLAESQHLVKKRVEEIERTRRMHAKLEDELRATADEHYQKSQQHEKEEAKAKAYVEQFQHKELHENVGQEEAAVPDSAIQNGVSANSNSHAWDTLRAGVDLATEQTRRRQFVNHMINAHKTAGVSDKGESMTKLIASTANIPPETVAQSIPELLEQLQAEKETSNRGIVGVQRVIA